VYCGDVATSYAPEAILEVRRYLKPITGLSDIELGIVNNETDASYHHGWSQRDSDGSDYSWDESLRDSSHKTNAARALDVGMFSRLREMSAWVVGQCQAGAADCADFREIIYSPDGVKVVRWDRLGIRTSGGLSHLRHTHFSWFADAENRRKVSPFQRFFEGGAMTPLQDAQNSNSEHYLQSIVGMAAQAEHISDTVQHDLKVPNLLTAALNKIQATLDAGAGISETRLRQIIREEIAKTRLS
jgi:hypothetical protein